MQTYFPANNHVSFQFSSLANECDIYDTVIVEEYTLRNLFINHIFVQFKLLPHHFAQQTRLPCTSQICHRTSGNQRR